MTYVIGSRVRPANRDAMIEGFTGQARPKLTAAGANRVDGLEWLTGDNAGIWTSASQWESLQDGFSALQDFYADPETQASLQTIGVEPMGRVVGVIEATAGDLDGPFVGITTTVVPSPDPGRLQAMADIGVRGGAKGVQIVRMFAGAGALDIYVGAVTLDRIDDYAQVTAEVAAANAEHFTAMNASMTDRLITRAH